MPITLQTYSRRDFIQSVASATAGWVTVSTARGDSGRIDPKYFILMADTHIDVPPGNVRHGQNMSNNLQTCVRRILENPPLPVGLVINGDCSFNIGERESYEHLAKLLHPLREAGVAVHMSMGNHDHRANFYSVFSGMQPAPAYVDDRHILILDTEHAYIFILDSLIHVENAFSSKGCFGEEQLVWLEKALARHKNKPVHVFAHHYPNNPLAGLDKFSYVNGIEDPRKFLAILSKHSQVQSYFYGHAHFWDVGNRHPGGFELVGQPATGYIFREEQATAYLHAKLAPGRMAVRFEAIDTTHPFHGQEHSVVSNDNNISIR